MVALPTQHTRTHAEPRISANDLARFMVATDTGRIGIIRRSREVSTAVVVRYADARATLRAALCDPVNERRIVGAARDSVQQRSEDSALTDFARDDALKSVDVMDAFSEMRNQIAGHDYVQAPAAQPPLSLAGVTVSVNCDVLIHRSWRSIEEIGAALFRLTKPEEDESDRARDKRREMGAYAATLAHMQVTANLCGDRQPNPNLCWSLDIQNREVHTAPRNYRQRAANLESACRFISAVWDQI